MAPIDFDNEISRLENNIRAVYIRTFRVFGNKSSGRDESKKVADSIRNFIKKCWPTINIQFFNLYRYGSEFDGSKNTLITEVFDGGNIDSYAFDIWREDLNLLLKYAISLRQLIKYKLPLEMLWGISELSIKKLQAELDSLNYIICGIRKKKNGELRGLLSIEDIKDYLKKSLNNINNKDIDEIEGQLKGYKSLRGKRHLKGRNKIARFINYFYWVKKASHDSNTIIHIPFSTVPEDTPMGMVLGLRLKTWNKQIIRFISELRSACIIATKINIEIDVQKHKKRILNHSYRSALSAILARNMSHNIGSHVLARLSNEKKVTFSLDKLVRLKGEHLEIEDVFTEIQNKLERFDDWSNDVRNLLRYLQERQDFLATISTDWQVGWSDGAYLMQDIMRWFFQQKLILDNLAASEELSGHVYKKNNGGGKERFKDIRFHVFLVGKNRWDLEESGGHPDDKLLARSRQSKALLYTDAKGGCDGDLGEDIQVAIPGGLLGYHAFYIILENIIRNAARHSFIPEADHLDVVLEIFDDIDSEMKLNIGGEKYPVLLFRIYNNVGYIGDGRGITLWKNNKNSGINNMLGQSFIDKTGKLQRKYWGMAEMKIASGFLQGRDVETIASENEDIYGSRKSTLKELGMKPEGAHCVIRAVKSPIGTLGYEFYVRKPMTIGIVCS